jgi:hypothetical protein
LFKISKLITTPKPGTSVFPAGTAAGKVFVVVSLEDVVGALTIGGGADSTAGDAGGGGGGGGSAISGGGSAKSSGAGGGSFGTLNGLDGFTGLLMFVGFVAFFTQEFTDSIQGETTG